MAPSTRTTLSARAPGSGLCTPPSLAGEQTTRAQRRPSRTGESLRLGFEVGVFGCVGGEDVVEDLEEAAVLFEGLRRRRKGGRGAYCEGLGRRCGGEVGQEVAGGV